MAMTRIERGNMMRRPKGKARAIDVMARPRIALAFPSQFSRMRYAGGEKFQTILSYDF
jgi:hypothetical protein